MTWVLGAILISPIQPARALPSAAASCREWRACEQLALTAAERGEFEAFHDLAWRAVQTGPRNDAALMYLLARAQSLSGRPHDALVMLGRLADAGALPAEAALNDDFARVRQLPGWADLAARIARTAEPQQRSMLPPTPPAAAPPGPRASAPVAVEPPPGREPTTAPEPSTAAAEATPVNRPLARLPPPTEASRFRTDAFSVAGLAYDAVSERFLFGDRLGRKLRVVGDRADHSVDLARADSGGFRDIGAIAIDARRGDLWVASADDRDAGALLHKLQLISGRTLKTFPIAAESVPVQPTDLAVTPSGTIIVLDAGSRRLMTLRPGQTAVDLVVHLKTLNPSSVTVGEDEDTAYVAHDGGLARVSLRAGTITPLTLPGKDSPGRFESIRMYRKSIVAIQRLDGSRRVLKLEPNDRGTSIHRAIVVADGLPSAGRISAAVSGDDLVYVIDNDDTVAASATDVVVYRVRLN